MILYHATRSEFSEFRLDGDHSQGVNGGAVTNKDGYGIYLFKYEEDAHYLVDKFFRKFSYDSEKQFDYLQTETVPHMDCSPFLQTVKSKQDCQTFGPKSFIFVNGWIVERRDYEAHLYKEKLMEPNAVRMALTHCILEKKALTKTELSHYIHDRLPRLTPAQIAPVATHFAGKTIVEKLLAIPFKGRVLRVTLSDEAKILDDGKTLAENNAVYDLDAMCTIVYPNANKDPIGFMEKVKELYFLANFHCWRDHSHETRTLFYQTTDDLSRTLTAHHNNAATQDGATANKIHTLAKTALKTLLDNSTYHAIRTISERGCGDKDALISHVAYDGVLFRNLDPYNSDAYCVHNLELLRIEAYKPFGANEWLPVQPTRQTTQTITPPRDGGRSL